MRNQTQSTRIFAACFWAFVFTFPLTAKDFDSLHLVPLPKQVIRQDGICTLTEASNIIARDRDLLPIANILAHDIYMQTGVRLPVVVDASGGRGIIVGLDPQLASEGYTIDINDSVEVYGQDYRAVVWGSRTIQQLLTLKSGKISFPRLGIEDTPDYQFRSVLIDLARRWHPVDTVKQTIELLSMYKVKYMHLHLSDTQSCVYTSRVLPKMATSQAYSWEEMSELVKYADERGVTIIPEIDVPGHSSSWVRQMPETFGTTDPGTGESKSIGIVNMANEKAYHALDKLVEELTEVFASSPYIHIGTDETGAGGLIKLPEYEPYCEKHGLSLAAKGNAHELFLHFIQRMSEIVKKHGKQPVAWNDFGGASTPNAQVPKDVLMTVWTGSPVSMAKQGYSIVNCCWVPLYMVPPQQRAPEDVRIYNWNVREYGNWHAAEPEIIAQEAPVEGAQLCFWEQRYNEVLPILRPRLPAFAERLWNENAGRTFEDFQKRREHTDAVARSTILPVDLQVEGLIDPRDECFDDKLIIALNSKVPGTIRYTIDNQWEHFPDGESQVYTGPITLENTATVSACLYDSDNRPLGGITQQRYRKIVPAYDYRILGPTPDGGWSEMPEFAELQELRSGVIGLMDTDRSDQINRSMFAGLPPKAHVDVRVHNVYNVKTIELKGQIRIPRDGPYSFKIRTGHGMSELYLDNKFVAASRNPGQESLSVGQLSAGTYAFTIKHFHYRTRNELNIWAKPPGAEEFEPFETLVLPIAERVDASDLSRVPADANFNDPAKTATRNLATDKKVTTSGGWQGSWIPTNAVDGIADNSSGWHAEPYPQWLQVDLGKSFSVNRIKLYPYYDGRRYYQYTIEVSTDGKQWSSIVDMTKNVEPSSKAGDEHNFDTVQARYIKVNMLNNSSNSGVHINELMVFKDTK